MDINTLHNISYGIYIISSFEGDKYNGQIANALIQITNDPATVAISINKGNFTHEMIEKSGLFSVSILERSTPLKMIGKFGFKSGRDIDKFKDSEFKLFPSGCPVILDNTLCCFDAKVVNKMDCGTYTVFLGEVMESEIIRDGEAMTYDYYHQVKCGLTPETAPTYIKDEKTEGVCAGPAKYRCTVCNYIYNPAVGDPDSGINPGTAFEDIPEDWVCPICGVGEDKFVKVEG